ncbi:MAG: hypothetical protein KBH99_09810 [Syntrophobacteraceae bacterium]|nr:hypothetical protein [Syntrophobacteraceae bacterium]
MAKKQDSKTARENDGELVPQESRELEWILDRLSVQSPQGASLESCLRSMREALSGREKLVAALVDRLSKQPSEVSFRAFRCLEGLVEDRKYRRIIKQAGYRFRQKGYVWNQEKSETGTVILIPREERKPIAHLISGDEVFLLVSALIPQAGTSPGSLTISAYAEESFSGLNVRVVEGSNRLYRDYVQKLTDVMEVKPVEIPIRHAARLYSEMLGYCGRWDPTPEAERARRLFQPFLDLERNPYVYELMTGLENPDQLPAGVDMKRLFDHVPFKWLLIPKKDLEPYWQSIWEMNRSVLVVPDETQYRRAQEIVWKAADEICTGGMRRFYRRFFEEQALWFKLRGNEEMAESSWIVAQHLAGTASAGDNPAVHRMVIVSMRHHWPEEVKKVVESAQVEKDPGPFYRSESGLILPR